MYTFIQQYVGIVKSANVNLN